VQVLISYPTSDLRTVKKSRVGDVNAAATRSRRGIVFRC